MYYDQQGADKYLDVPLEFWNGYQPQPRAVSPGARTDRIQPGTREAQVKDEISAPQPVTSLQPSMSPSPERSQSP